MDDSSAGGDDGEPLLHEEDSLSFKFVPVGLNKSCVDKHSRSFQGSPSNSYKEDVVYSHRNGKLESYAYTDHEEDELLNGNVPSTSNQSEGLPSVHISCFGESCSHLTDTTDGFRRSVSLPYIQISESENEKEEKDDEDKNSSSSVPFSLWSTSRREKLILASLASVELSSYMCLSIMAPFFPDEAAKQGISDTISGWIFGVFALSQFVFSPVFGKLMPRVGARFMFLAGQFFAGGCIMLFGVFLALGCTASNTASFAITAYTFPENIATVFGLLETATGLGMMAGPAIGGFLYEFGGFIVPFVTLGALMLVTVPLNIIILPREDAAIERLHAHETSSLVKILKIPAVLVVCFSVVVAAVIWSILDPTLEPHLSIFNLSSTMVGLVFLLMSAFYAVSAPVWGWLADKIPDSIPMLIVGFLASALGLFLLGPTPLFGFDPDYNELWLNLIALIILGLSSSLALVPTFEKILDAVEKAGMEDNFAMYGIVAGLWGGCYALGDFIGPTVGGWGLDYLGFAWCMTYTGIGCLGMAAMLFILWIWEIRCGSQETSRPADPDHPATERTPLLSSGRTTPRALLVRSLSVRSTGQGAPVYYQPLSTSNQTLAPQYKRRSRFRKHLEVDFETTSLLSENSTMTV